MERTDLRPAVAGPGRTAPRSPATTRLARPDDGHVCRWPVEGTSRSARNAVRGCVALGRDGRCRAAICPTRSTRAAPVDLGRCSQPRTTMVRLDERDQSGPYGRNPACHLVASFPGGPGCRVDASLTHPSSATVSPWRWATFHSPASRRYTWVALRV